MHEWKIRNDAQYARAEVLKRDHGVCCQCGANTEALRLSAYDRGCPHERLEPYRIAWELGLGDPYQGRGYRLLPEVEAALDQADYLHQEILAEWRAHTRDRHRELMALGYPGDVSRSWWEADHIKPVVEGGGQCGLDNLRTLCVPCHRVATAELAARRARARRTATTPQPELSLDLS